MPPRKKSKVSSGKQSPSKPSPPQGQSWDEMPCPSWYMGPLPYSQARLGLDRPAVSPNASEWEWEPGMELDAEDSDSDLESPVPTPAPRSPYRLAPVSPEDLPAWSPDSPNYHRWAPVSPAPHLQTPDSPPSPRWVADSPFSHQWGPDSPPSPRWVPDSPPSAQRAPASPPSARWFSAPVPPPSAQWIRAPASPPSAQWIPDSPPSGRQAPGSPPSAQWIPDSPPSRRRDRESSPSHWLPPSTPPIPPWAPETPPVRRRRAPKSAGSRRRAAESPASRRGAAKSPASRQRAAESPASRRGAAKSPASRRRATESPASRRGAAKSPASRRRATKSPVSRRRAAESPASRRRAAESPGHDLPAPELHLPAPEPPALCQPAPEPPVRWVLSPVARTRSPELEPPILEPELPDPEPRDFSPDLEPPTLTPEFEPFSLSPEHPTAEPMPELLGPEPPTSEPMPELLAPEPPTAEPEPELLAPEPPTAEPEPELLAPEPPTAEPEPELLAPEPTGPPAPGSLEEILASVPPPPERPQQQNGQAAPRLMISHIVNLNFKSYAGRKLLGPFHKHFSCIIGPNGSGKSNVIDAMLFVFGYRAHKIRSRRLAGLIHCSEAYPALDSCTVEVHFQMILDLEGDDYEVLPDQGFCVSRTAYRNNSSIYHISGKKATFRDVGCLLRKHGIDLDHNRFLILQGEVEQISLMKPKAQGEHDEGMLEYLEGIIGCARLKQPIQILGQRMEMLAEQRGEKVTRAKLVENEKQALAEERNAAIQFLELENEVFKKKNHVCQYYIYDLRKRIAAIEAQKEKIQEGTKDINQKGGQLADKMKAKSKAVTEVEEKINRVTRIIEESKEKYTQLDLETVEAREKLKHAKSEAKKLEKQLQKDKEKVEEVRGAPAVSEKMLSETVAKKNALEKAKEKEEGKLKKVMDNLKKETKQFQDEKEKHERDLMELNKTVNEARSKMDVAQSELDLYLSPHNSVVSQLSEAREAFTAASKTLKERKAAIRNIKNRLPPAERDLKDKEKEIQRLTQEAVAVDSSLQELLHKVEEGKSSLAASRSRGKVLKALILQKKSGRISGIHGRLGDLGAIDEKYDVAISSCCNALDYIVVDTIDVAQVCVNFLKKHNIGVATFIGLDKIMVSEGHMRPIETPENIPRLFDLVQVKDEKIRRAFYFALRDTLVANNLDQATRVAFQNQKRWRVVTLQGQIIELSGTMTGGGKKQLRGRIGSSLVEVTEEEVAQMEFRLQKDSHKAAQIRGRKARLEEAVTRLRPNVESMQNSLEKFTANIQSLAEQEVYFDAQVKELEANVRDTAPDENKKKLLEGNIAAFKKEYEHVSKKANRVEADVKRLHRLIVEITSHRLKVQQDKVDKVSVQLDRCVSAVTKAQVAVKTADKNLQKAQDVVLQTEKEIKDNEKEMEDLTCKLKSLKEKSTEVMKTCKEAKDSLPKMQKEHRRLLQEIKKMKDKEHTLQSDALSIKLKLEQLDSKIAEHNSKIKYWQKEISKISLHAIDDNPVEEIAVLSQEELEAIRSPDALNRQIALLEARRNSMSPNLASIEAYKKKAEQHEQRLAELQAVIDERNRFRSAYEKLRRQRLNEFMAGFAIITNKLKENYQMLALGGDAELELIDSLDPFSEGVLFSVRPPHKSWKNMVSLSGGEKTLSSLALVFALHHYKPTPLYFMDEIDAALDFKNVSIVAFYIYRQTKNTQFIVITLRNNMFEIADRLIGVYKNHDVTHSVAINPKTISRRLPST